MLAGKYALVFFVILICLVSNSFGQNCTPEALAQKPGLLRASKLSGSTRGVSPTDLARERALLTNVHKMIAASYNPVGVVGEYSFRFSSGQTVDTFGYSLYLLRYNCDKNSADKSKFYIGTDTPTVVRIDANVINSLNLSAADITDNTFRGYLLMRNLPKKVDGAYYLGDNPDGDSRPNQKAYTYLITHSDALPFSVLTRKEYLLLTKARLEKSIKENGNSSGFYNEYVNRVEEHLRKSESELSQPAVVNRTDEERFTGFLREGERGAYFAIKHNPAYYRKGLPKSTAHFFTVVYSVYEGDKIPVYVDNINAVRKAVDFNVLKQML
jgi:hypothetical protein